MYSKIISIVTIATLLLSGCGNKSTKTEDTAAPQNMIQDATKDDGQGVGKYKNVTLGTIDSKTADMGKILFDAKCADCHRTTGEKLIGPGLMGVTEKRQAAWILNMITNPAEMIKSDPTAIEMIDTFKAQMTFQDVNDEQARQILEFLRTNDGGGAADAKK